MCIVLDGSLSDRHRSELAASAITPERIVARGYATITDSTTLPAAFTGRTRTTGLLMPITNTQGEMAGWQLKPDAPWIGKNGKPAKYLTAGRMCLDVPEAARPSLRNPNIPLWITEGIKKVDSAVCHGIPCIIGVQGVWNYREDKVALPDWDDLALKGRTVIVAYDSDVMRKAGPRGALDALAKYLEHRGATVRFCLMPDLPDGAKCGLDDAFVAGLTRAKLEKMIVDALPDAEPESEEPIPDAPTFPLDVLPDTFASYVAEHAAAIGVPAEMIAVPLLANVGALIGNRLALQLKNGFRQYAALWVGVVAEPGRAKTPAINVARSPLDVLQIHWYDTYTEQRAVWDADLERWQEGKKGERGAKPVRPALRHAYTTDATTEAIGVMLDSTHGLSLQHDELAGFVRSMDQYRNGKGADRQKMLSFWAATATKIDRKGGEPLLIRRPVVSVVGGIQPDVLGDLRDRNGKEDGFVDRFILIRPDVQRRGWSEDEASPGLLDAVVMAMKMIDAALPPKDADNPELTVRLHPDARAVWRRWYDATGDEAEASSGLRAGVLGKLPLQVARIALILNTLRNLDEPQRMVSEAVMRDAIRLGSFIVAHWDRCLPLIGQPVPVTGTSKVDVRALRILRDGSEQDSEGWVTRSRVSKRLGNVSPSDLTDALTALQADGVVERRTVETETKPREEWRAVAIAASREGNSQWDYSDVLPLPPEIPNIPIGIISIESAPPPTDPTPPCLEGLPPTGTDDGEWEGMDL